MRTAIHMKNYWKGIADRNVPRCLTGRWPEIQGYKR